MQELNITLMLLQRPFKLKVQPHLEQNLRAAVKSLNLSVDQYRKSYPGREESDYLSMAIITFVTEQVNNNGAAATTEFTNTEWLDAIEKEITK